MNEDGLIKKTYLDIKNLDNADPLYKHVSSRTALKHLYNMSNVPFSLLECDKNKEENQLEYLTDEEKKEIHELFEVGMLNESRFGTFETDKRNSENYLVGILGLRRTMTEKEKLIFLQSLNRIYGYKNRYKLITIFFLERHSEKERYDSLEELEKDCIAMRQEEAKGIKKEI